MGVFSFVFLVDELCGTTYDRFERHWEIWRRTQIISYNNEVLFFKSVHHSPNLLHNHPTNRPRTNSHFKVHMRPILAIQSPFSNSSSSRKFLQKQFLSRDMLTSFRGFSYA